MADKLVIMFLEANPQDNNALDVQNEIREIETRIRASKHRETFDFKAHLAARADDLMQALLEREPNVVHFAGHGHSKGLSFRDDAGNTRNVSSDALLAVLRAQAREIPLLLMTSCDTADMARHLTSGVQVAIGMDGAVSDDTARVFSASFYRALAFGLSVETAFKQAVAAILVEGTGEENVPRLHVRTGIDAARLVLVPPNPP